MTLTDALIHRPLLVVALHSDQLDLFRRAHGLSPNIIRRIRRPTDLHGYNPKLLVLIVLHDAGNESETFGAIRQWKDRKGQCYFTTKAELTNRPNAQIENPKSKIQN